MHELFETKIAKHNKVLKEYNEVLAKKQPVETLSNKDLEKLLRALKRDTDGAMPKKKEALLTLYKKLEPRGVKPAPVPPSELEMNQQMFSIEKETLEDGTITQIAEM